MQYALDIYDPEQNTDVICGHIMDEIVARVIDGNTVANTKQSQNINLEKYKIKSKLERNSPNFLIGEHKNENGDIVSGIKIKYPPINL